MTRARRWSRAEYGSTKLELLEEHQAKVEALRKALIEGEQSGVAVPFDFDAFIDRKKST